jgi:thiamine-phosphate pyrophosphorylase
LRSTPQPTPLYAIADAEAVAPRTLSQAIEVMAAAGLGWIQLRAKRLGDRELYRELQLSHEVAQRRGSTLWIDDRADLAALCPVAGLHLGQADLPPQAARRVVGRTLPIGRSTHTEAEFRQAAEDPAVDLIALGPIYPTTGKERPDPVVGLGLLRRLAPTTAKPVVAIGGIDRSNLRAVLAAGADSVAVLGAVCRGDIEANCRRLLAALEGSA